MHLLSQDLETKSEMEQFRRLLLLEHFLRTDLVQVEVMMHAFESVLEKLTSDDVAKRVKIKALKILLTLRRLKQIKN